MEHIVKKSLLGLSSAALVMGLSACSERPEAVGAYSPEPGIQEREVEGGVIGDRTGIGEERPGVGRRP